MKIKFYLNEKWFSVLALILGAAVFFPVNAQVYSDTTGLKDDLEAGVFEEYILAPASVEDTFFIPSTIQLSTSVIIKAQDDLGFKPVVTGTVADEPNYLFEIADVIGSASIELHGVRITGSIGVNSSIDDGTFKIITENVDLLVKDCEMVDFGGYNAVAKVFNNGVNITLEDVLVYNCAGKIIQVNYDDDDDSPDYVPHMGDLTVKNSTFAKIYKRIWFELGAGNVQISDGNGGYVEERFNAGADNVVIDHCTFYDFVGINVMQGRELYTFGGEQSAVKNTLAITNTVFAAMDENLNADSASVWTFDYNYYDFGNELAPEDLEDFSKYSATNTIVTAPVFADTADGAWDLTLQNEGELIGSDGTPIGDPRWWQQEWIPDAVNDMKADIANVYSFRDRLIISTKGTSEGVASVYSITGQMIRVADLNSSRTEITLKKGLYIVRVKTTDGVTARKVLITE